MNNVLNLKSVSINIKIENELFVIAGIVKITLHYSC